MPVPQELVAIVVCPRCKGQLEHRAVPEAFLCRACKLVYEVVDDIPNFLIEEAKPLG
jgi:uncharacterized protein